MIELPNLRLREGLIVKVVEGLQRFWPTEATWRMELPDAAGEIIISWHQPSIEDGGCPSHPPGKLRGGTSAGLGQVRGREGSDRRLQLVLSPSHPLRDEAVVICMTADPIPVDGVAFHDPNCAKGEADAH